MSKWKDEARAAIWAAAINPDPNVRPVYRVKKHRPWWAFWRKTEWETYVGMSRADGERIAELMRRFPA